MTEPLTSLESFRFIVPELVLGGGAVLLFLLAAFTRRNSVMQAAFPWLGGLFISIAGGMLLWSGTGGCGEGRVVFDGLIACDPLATFFRGLVLLAVLLGVLLSANSPSLPKNRQGEYFGLLLVMATGMSLLAAANHLLMIFVAMETVSLCSYLLVGWDDSRQRSQEAGLKYVLYGGVASGIMLFGMSLLYGVYGTLSLQGLHEAILSSPVLGSEVGRWAAWVALAFTLTGFGFKIAAAPFHQWCPDAYEGAPTPFTALLSVGPKAAGFALILRFVWNLFASSGDLNSSISVDIPWALVIGLMSALTMTIGNLVAVVQDNLKRLLAYSSIAHAGYMLMGVVAGGVDGFESVSIYMAIYVIMNMGAFAVVAAVARSTGSEDIKEYRGLGKRAPVLAIMMVIFLVSLTGLPPTAGFIGKLYLFAAIVAKGGTWYWALAIVGVLNSVISLFYYARVMKAMYLEKAPADAKPVREANMAGAMATVLAIPTLLLGIFWQPLAVMASWSARMFH